jgi:Flp pilus assembly protein CpaB
MSTSTRATNGRAISEGLAPLGLTPEAALRRSGRRLNARLVTGIVIVAGAFVGFLLFVVSATPDTFGVLVPTRDLPVGARLHSSDLAIARVRLGEEQARVAIPAAQLDSLEGRELVAPVFAQQILAQKQLATSERSVLKAGYVKMTIPVKADNAVGGTLRPGDQVAVLVTTDRGKPTAQTRTVLSPATVDSSGRSDSGFSGSTVGTSSAAPATSSNAGAARAGRPIDWVTLIVPDGQAQSLALARWNGELDVILLPVNPVDGSAEERATPPSVQ